MAEDRSQIATIRTLISGATMLSDYTRICQVIVVGSEMMLTNTWRSSVKATYAYHEVQIPLMGYHMFDFSVNKDVKT